jgi:hypothetical protein
VATSGAPRQPRPVQDREHVEALLRLAFDAAQLVEVVEDERAAQVEGILLDADVVGQVEVVRGDLEHHQVRPEPEPFLSLRVSTFVTTL